MWRCGLVLLMVLVVSDCFSQNRDSLLAQNRDSIRYTKLKQKMKSTRITGELYNLLFRDVYNRKAGAQVSEIENNPFQAYEGLAIGRITIRQLDVLGQSVYDTTRRGNKLERFSSKTFHVNTRERIIRNTLLLFQEGDLIDSRMLRESERLLRQSPTILDARILVHPREGVSWMADITVYIQDIWSLIPSASFSGFQDFSVGLDNKNVRGMAHNHFTRIRWNARDTVQKFEFRTVYTIPYIAKTFVSGQAGFIWERDLKQQYIRFSKPFLTIETKYAGSVEMGHSEIREQKRFADNLSQVVVYPVEYRYYDFWLGRAFKSPFGSDQQREKSRIVLAVRANQYEYYERPEVRSDTNQLYWNRSTFLLGLGFSNRDYTRDLLIYGFGRTEDVPIGTRMSLTVGGEKTEFGGRGYAGIQAAMGHYLPRNLGYFYGLANVGSYYFGEGELRQGIVSAQVNYFTPLVSFGLTKVRQFVNLKFVQGVNRDPIDYINISGDRGFRGVSSDQLIGNRYLTLGLETVVFSPGSILGFRAAIFGFTDLGLVTLNRSIWSSPFYQGYGVGLRLRNENLTFNTIQIRLGYYPNIIGIRDPFRYAIQGETPLRFSDFDISAPEILHFR